MDYQNKSTTYGRSYMRGDGGMAVHDAQQQVPPAMRMALPLGAETTSATFTITINGTIAMRALAVLVCCSKLTNLRHVLHLAMYSAGHHHWLRARKAGLCHCGDPASKRCESGCFAQVNKQLL